jgi:uncharacterized protein YjbI with pentapeptide repeats
MMRQANNQFLLGLFQNRDAFNICARRLSLLELHALAGASYDADQIVLDYLISDPVRLIYEFHKMSVHTLVRFIDAHNRLEERIFNVAKERQNRYALACALLMSDNQKLLTLSAHVLNDLCENLPALSFPSSIHKSILFHATLYSRVIKTAELSQVLSTLTADMPEANKLLSVSVRGVASNLTQQAISHSFASSGINVNEQGEDINPVRMLNFRGINLAEAAIADIDVSQSCFTNADFSRACFKLFKTSVTIKTPIFNDVSFKNAKFDSVRFDCPNNKKSYYESLPDKMSMQRCDFSYASFQFAVIANVTMEKSKFHFTDLSFASFTGADLSHSDFSNSIHKETKFAECSLNHANFSNLNLSTTQFSGGEAVGADFSRAKISIDTFKRANLSGSILRECHLKNFEIDYGYKELSDTDFSCAKLNRANFHRLKLIGVDFSYANLVGSSFHSAELIRVNFTRAILTDVDFTCAAYLEVSFFKCIMTEDNLSDLLKFYDDTLKDSDTFFAIRKVFVLDLVEKVREAQKDFGVDHVVGLLEIAARHPLFSDHRKHAALKSEINNISLFSKLDGAALIKTQSQKDIIKELDRLREIQRANKKNT